MTKTCGGAEAFSEGPKEVTREKKEVRTIRRLAKEL